MIDGGIAVEDLGKKQVDDRDGIKQTAAPGMIDLATCIDDLGALKLFSGGILESAKDTNDTVMHNVLLSEMVSVYHLYAKST